MHLAGGRAAGVKLTGVAFTSEQFEFDPMPQVTEAEVSHCGLRSIIVVQPPHWGSTTFRRSSSIKRLQFEDDVSTKLFASMAITSDARDAVPALPREPSVVSRA